MDELVSQFVAITDTTSEKARQYLNISDGNIENAVELFFTTGGVDLIENADSAPATSDQPSTTRAAATREQPEVIDLDSDEDEGIGRAGGQVLNSGTSRLPQSATAESDEAMARRLQEEMYAGTDVAGGVDAEGYRAPIARTRETLVGPDPYELNDHDGMRAAVEEQIMRRQQMRTDTFTT
jgi:UBX domain-containing protein 7